MPIFYCKKFNYQFNIGNYEGNQNKKAPAKYSPNGKILQGFKFFSISLLLQHYAFALFY
jgi:hypothetical protein